MKNHTCDACGGCGGHEWDGNCWITPDPCHVCLGTGKFSDVMPISDSLADAETLEVVADDAACWEGTPEPSGSLFLARMQGAEAVMAYVREDTGYAYVGAWRAAQYAFRAVPELRS